MKTKKSLRSRVRVTGGKNKKAKIKHKRVGHSHLKVNKGNRNQNRVKKNKVKSITKAYPFNKLEEQLTK